MHVQTAPGQPLVYEAVPDKLQPSHWKVQSTNVPFGDVYVVIFSGPLARERAIEYTEFKNSQM
jgi:hypothetical protein